MNQPPKKALAFLRWFCREDYLEEIEGDLIEVFGKEVEVSPRKAKWKFSWSVLKYFRPAFMKSFKYSNQTVSSAMLENYLKIGTRNTLKYKVFTFINVFGLALAMAVCMLIILMVGDQRRYDQFNSNKDRTFRILSNDGNSLFPYASSPVPLAGVLESDYPIVEHATQLIRGIGGDGFYNETVVEMRGFFADDSFFKVFSYELEKGNAQSALALPNSIVLTKDVADRLFHGEDPLGKIIEFSDRGLHYLGGYRNEPPATAWGNFKVTGIIADKGYKSHLKFDVLVAASSIPLLVAEMKVNDISTNWQNFYECFTYVMLHDQSSEGAFDLALEEVVKNQYADVEFFKYFKLESQKLAEITPGIFTANPTRFSLPLVGYYFLAFLAFIILVSACLNYINLSIARASTRMKEISVRKVTGAGKKAVFYQFMSESILTGLLAGILAGGLMVVLLPAFKGLWINQFLEFDLRAGLETYLIFIGFVFFIGAAAGLYPALKLSSLQPLRGLKSMDGMRSGKWGLRKVLSVAQFVISFFFITTSILIFNQFRHFLEFDYGMNADNIVNIALQGNDYQKVAAELRNVPGIGLVSASDIIPATGISKGTRVRTGIEMEYEYLSEIRTDEFFAENFEIKLLAGNNLPPLVEVTSRFILVNESAAKELGYENYHEIIGSVFEEEGSKESLEVIGVVKDFRHKLLFEEDEVGPLIMRNDNRFNFANVKIVSGDINGTIKNLEEKWKKIDPIHPIKYEFFDSQLQSGNRAVLDVVSIIGFIAVLAIVIACLGLLGMAIFMAERKTKEVGIRKVLGAQELNIVILLSGELLRVLIFSILIGAPLSYFLNNIWLREFPNRVEFGFGTVFIGTIILFTLGLLTIGSQTLKASKRNPVHSLKIE